ncbi:D-alanine--D-alanine ligase B [compost metagenome]|uniref:D-alanine--D-alanine ligase n=1 Tax=Cupriavidus campinensis TaxID=151783 RepID=A0AAE9I0I3_9BURK|nr:MULTISPECIES: D-alanine--D-alanine ligase [Cupriavidus]TSP10313.1 D-alanine--D-alanine ligase [Cupriavidus campinensis]URF03742.1 D-alanine--D-alanine ligase [Cupriavidus campinensis]CAG2146773.1 D-alanine--D-alanine ligase B [Cupriavidus campinensis]
MSFVAHPNIDPKSLGKVGVLLGGRSAEREVSLMSGNGVLAALRARGVDAHPFDPALQPVAELAAAGFDRVFIALHGRYGEDGTIQGMLEMLGIPYTGSGVLASALAMDKPATKRLWMSHGLPTPRFAVLRPDTDFNAVVADLGLPLIVKPAREGSSIGLTKVTDASQMREAFERAAVLDDDVLAESFIDGAELTCPIVGEGATAEALPVIKIVAPESNYDYQNKYFTDVTQYLCPSTLPEALENEVRALAVEAFRVLGCRGWARADVMLTRDGKPYLLEMNTSPGMTGHSLVPMAARAVGISYEDFVIQVVAQATLDLHPNEHWKP